MIFNKKYTEIIKLATENDPELEVALKKIVSTLTKEQKDTLRESGEFYGVEYLENGKLVKENYKSDQDFYSLGKVKSNQDLVSEYDLGNYDRNYKNGTVNEETWLDIYQNAINKHYRVEIVNFNVDWLNNLHNYESLEEYEQLSTGEGVEATDILTVDVFDNDITGGTHPDDSTTYSLWVVRANNQYYLLQNRIFDELIDEQSEPSNECQLDLVIPISYEKLCEIANIECELQDNKEATDTNNQ